MTSANKSKRDAFTDVYSDYYPVVYSAVYTRIENVDDAKDISQEVFLRLYRKFPDVENVRRWLFTALKLVIMEYYKKKERREVDIEKIFDEVTFTFVNGFRDARIIMKDLLEDDETFQTGEERIIFDLIAINNFTYSQTAKELGMTRRQVEYRYGQIVERMLDLLKKRGIQNIEDML